MYLGLAVALATWYNNTIINIQNWYFRTISRVVSSEVWKNWVEKNRLKWTLKIADIYSDKLSESLGRCPKNPQGTYPLTHSRALPEPILAGRQEKGAVAPFLLDRMIHEPYVNKLSRHILTVGDTACSGIPRFYWQ